MTKGPLFVPNLMVLPDVDSKKLKDLFGSNSERYFIQNTCLKTLVLGMTALSETDLRVTGLHQMTSVYFCKV